MKSFMVLLLVALVLDAAAAENTWTLSVADYYPDEDREASATIDTVMREHISAARARDLEAILATVNPLQEESARAFWSDAFATYDTVKTDIMGATWLGKDNYFSYVRVLLFAETYGPKTLETQIWVFTPDNGRQTILQQFTVFSLDTDKMQKRVFEK